MRKSRQTRPPSGRTARRWIAARHSSGTAATSPPGTESCCEHWKRFGNCGLRVLDWGMGKQKRRMANAGWRMARGKCRMANGRWRMTEGRWRRADAGRRTTSGKRQMTNGKWQMTNGEWRMADDEWQMASHECRVAEDGCEMRSGGCGDGERSKPTQGVSQGPIVGHDSNRVIDDSTNDKIGILSQCACNCIESAG